MRRKESFDEVAEQYDAFRPALPPAVVSAVTGATRMRSGTRVLEIGCGTGQLSVPLARQGVELTAIDLGANLAARAASNLAAFPNARVEVSAFEEFELPGEPFDAVVCANAFHWLDPEVRFAKCGAALCATGYLAILHTHHVAGGTEAFFADTQPLYVNWGLSTDASFRPPEPDAVAASYPELDDRSEFGPVSRQRFEIPMSHTTDSYVGWLRTDSMVNTLEHDARIGFLHDIEEMIESRYGGSVVRNFVYELVVAARV